MKFKFSKYIKYLGIGNRPTKNEMIQFDRCKKWFADKGDETLRLDYLLDESSVVIDIGGYHGEFARDIFCKYNATIYIFEPIEEFYNIIVRRFCNNPKVKVFNFGLGCETIKTKIGLDANSSSLFIQGSDTVTISIKSCNEFFKEHKLTKIDLMKINIEGAEYDLLESIIAENNISKISNIQVQFHDFIIENAKERMISIQKSLEKTHFLTYQYEFVWENWKLKGL